MQEAREEKFGEWEEWKMEGVNRRFGEEKCGEWEERKQVRQKRKVRGEMCGIAGIQALGQEVEEARGGKSDVGPGCPN